MPTYFIPYPWLPHFALTEDRVDHRERTAFPRQSILNLLIDAGGSYFYEAFTALGFRSPYSSDAERLAAVIDDVRSDPKDLYLVYLARADAAGHQFGLDSEGLRSTLHALDTDLARFAEQAEAARPGGRYLFVGDHGMCAVSRAFDAERELARIMQLAEILPGKDVLYFLDSTLVRLWALTDRARNALPALLTQSQAFRRHGEWMYDESAASKSVPWPDRRYGDYLWCADPGVVVSPDFFQGEHAPKGMHGYVKPIADSWGMCIRWGAGVEPATYSELPLTEVFNLLRSDLHL